MHITTEAIVLRERLIEDYDSVVTLLSKQRGVITAYAKGARKPRSTLRVAAEQLSYCDFVLFASRDRYSVDKAEVSRLFMGIRSDVEKLALVSYFSQLMIELAPREEPAEEYLRLLLNCLHLLDKDRRTCVLVKPVFELRLMTMAGFMPNLVGCTGCGAFTHEQMAFFPQTGEIVCGDCLPTRDPQAVRLLLEAGVLAAMRHIAYSEFDKIFNFTLPDVGLERLNELTQLYVLMQTEKKFDTLTFYLSMR